MIAYHFNDLHWCEWMFIFGSYRRGKSNGNASMNALQSKKFLHIEVYVQAKFQFLSRIEHVHSWFPLGV